MRFAGNKTLVMLLVAGCCVCILKQVSAAQDQASPEEVVSKVHEAAAVLAKSGETGLADFDKKPGPWGWKDTYVFVMDCAKGVMVAHPKADLIGKPLTSLKDAKGGPAFELLCAAMQNPNGVWVEYWIPKPGEKDGSRKVSYGFAVARTPYVAGAGIFDSQTPIVQLEKTAMK